MRAISLSILSTACSTLLVSSWSPSAVHAEITLDQLGVGGFVDVDFCYSALADADSNGDGSIKGDEYVAFLQQLGPDMFLDDVTSVVDLPIILNANFNVLACLCTRDSPEGDDTCCVGANAGLDTAGADPSQMPTESQQSYLFWVCSLTNIAIDRVLQSSPPTAAPSDAPSVSPSSSPSLAPSAIPSDTPSFSPTVSPSRAPSEEGDTFAPTKADTFAPTKAPVATDPPTATPVADIVVQVVYTIAVRDGKRLGLDSSTYQDDLVASMNSLAPEVLSGLDTRRTRLLLRGNSNLNNRRRLQLQSVRFPTLVDSFTEVGRCFFGCKLFVCFQHLSHILFPLFYIIIMIDCPPEFTNVANDRCEDVAASIVLLFQEEEEEDPEAVASEFQIELKMSIEEGDLQSALDNTSPSSNVYILNGREEVVVPPTNRGTGDDDSISVGGIAGIAVGGFAFVFLLAGLLLARRNRDEKPDYDDLEPAPKELSLDDGGEDEEDEALAPRVVEPPKKTSPKTKKTSPKSKLAAAAMLGATTPDYGMLHEKEEEMDLKEFNDAMDDDHDRGHDHDSSSNAGSSGWSSSAGVSSLNTGSIDGFDDSVVGGIAVGTTLAAIGLASHQRVSSETEEGSVPAVSRADLDSAIEAGDWAAVGATAALLAAASDSQSYSSRSGQLSGTVSRSGTSVSSLDAARAAELDHLVDAGDWEGVVLAAAKYEASGEGNSNSQASHSQSNASDSGGPSTTGSAGESGTHPSASVSGSQSSTPSKAQKRHELRAQVEELVQRVVPEEIHNVDEMMLQFRGREEELIETLRTMQERAVAQKARQGAQKAAKLDAKRTTTAARATTAATAPRRADSDASSKSEARSMNTQASSTDTSGGFPVVNATSLGTGQVMSESGSSRDSSAKSSVKPSSERLRKQSALEEAIEAGDWEAVGEAAAMMSEGSLTSADNSEIDRLAAGTQSSDGSSAGASSRGVSSDRAAELDELIDKGDWTGVVAAASKYSTSDKEAPMSVFAKRQEQQEIEERRQKRLKRLQDEEDALAQAEIWMAIAEQSKQDTQKEAEGAGDAADWAIARSLSLLVEAEAKGQLDQKPPAEPNASQQDDDDGDDEV
jgi:hypothetical protein